MRYPHERFVRTLVAGRLSPEHILDRLKKHDLTFPLPGVQEIHDKLSQEQPEYFKKKSVSIEIQWLKDWDIEEMYGHLFNIHTPSVNPHDIVGALAILEDPLMKRLISSLAISNITSEDIELIVNGKYNVEYSHENIQMFLKYFFDVSDFTFADKKRLVEVVKDPDIKRFYKIALKGDKDYLLWKLGAAPDRSFDAMLRDMMSDSYYNFKERAKVDPELAQKWGALAIKLSDRIDRVAGDKASNEELFKEIEFKLSETKKDQEEPIHIDEISDKEKPGSNE